VRLRRRTPIPERDFVEVAEPTAREQLRASEESILKGANGQALTGGPARKIPRFQSWTPTDDLAAAPYTKP